MRKREKRVDSKVTLFIDDYKETRDVKIEFRCPVTKKHLSPTTPLLFTPKTQISFDFPRSHSGLVLTNFSVFTEDDLSNWLKVKFRIFQPHEHSIYEQIDPKMAKSVTPCFFFDESYLGRIPSQKTIKRKRNKNQFETHTQSSFGVKSEDECASEKAAKRLKSVHSSTSKQDICPICFSVKSHKTSVLSTCKHEYCFDCLSEWLLESQKCPECKQVSKSYVVKVGGRVLSQNGIGSKGRGHIREDSDIEQRVNSKERFDEECCRCRESKLDFLMLVCDACNKTCCHIFCLNPPLEYVPDDDWFCDECLKLVKRTPRVNRRKL